jgi:hypothetical protein
MKHDIFISYRRSDRELVANIVRRLEERGVGVWYDVEIEGGADWRETIVEALTEADMLVIFFSEDCNNSRQLKKELAIADNLNKPVVPILIENTQPRGAYLYELADRNWIQAFPDPMSKVEELVEHLVMLARNTPGGLAGSPQPAAQPASVAPSKMAAPPEAGAAADTVFAPAPAPAAIEEAAADEAPALKRAASPRATDAYVGKVSERGRKKETPTNDILPFRWIDLVFIVPGLAALAWFLNYGLDDTGTIDELDIAATGLVMIAAVALYGAFVFPFRYYLRNRPPLAALRNYLLSSALLYAVFMAAYLTMRFTTDIFGSEDPMEIAAMFGGIWVGFTIIAFFIYGVLSAHRALTRFRSNIKKI